MSKYAFISYNSDDKADAEQIKSALETNGIACWMAPGSISGGADYAEVIEKAIRNCTVFVLVLSKNTKKSEWVPKEVNRAVHYKKKIMPFRLDNIEPNDDIEICICNLHHYFVTSEFQKDDTILSLVKDIGAEFEITKKPFIRKKASCSKKKVLSLVIIVLTLLAVLLIVPTLKSHTNTSIQEQTESSEFYFDTSEKLLIGETNFVFPLLDDMYCVLPCEYQFFKNYGWTLWSGNKLNEDSLIDEGPARVYVYRNSRCILIELYNKTEQPQKLKDCMVYGIEISKDTPSNYQIPYGSPIGMNVSEVTSKIKQKPSGIKYYDNGYLYTYVFEENTLIPSLDINRFITLTFDKTDETCTGILIRNNVSVLNKFGNLG